MSENWTFVLFGAAMIVLLCSADAQAQSMEGWQRIPDAQLKFEQDHAACTPKPLPALGRNPALPTGGVSGNGTVNMATPLPPGPSFTQCMRAKGWVKPDEAPKARAAQ